MNKFTAAFACLISLMTHAALAQDAGSAPAPDPIAEWVLAPELIMRHQKAIQLNEAQKKVLIDQVKQAQGRMIDLQWDLQRAMEPLVELLSQDKVDEPAVMKQLDKVLAAEREIKRTHLGLAVRLKNNLTPEQQQALRTLRSARASEPPRASAPR